MRTSWNGHSWNGKCWGRAGATTFGKVFSMPKDFALIKEDIDCSFSKGSIVRILKRGELYFTCLGIIGGSEVQQEIKREELVECC